MSFPGGAVAENPPAKAGDTTAVSSTTGSGRSPGEGNGSLLQCSSLENSMGGGAWWLTVHGTAEESDMTERLSAHTWKKQLPVGMLTPPPLKRS